MSLDELTASQRAAWERGAARARAAVAEQRPELDPADLPQPTVADAIAQCRDRLARATGAST